MATFSYVGVRGLRASLATRQPYAVQHQAPHAHGFTHTLPVEDRHEGGTRTGRAPTTPSLRAGKPSRHDAICVTDYLGLGDRRSRLYHTYAPYGGEV